VVVPEIGQIGMADSTHITAGQGSNQLYPENLATPPAGRSPSWQRVVKLN